MEVSTVSGWTGSVPTWFGMPCSIGRVRVWLPEEGGPTLFRDLSLLALVPNSDLPDAPPYIHLGAQFLLEYRARVFLDCTAGTPGSSSGQLIIP